MSADDLRNALHGLLKDKGLLLPTYSDKYDRWDVFTITYKNLSDGPEATILLLDQKLRTLSHPSAQQLYAALSQERSALDAAVNAVAPRILRELQSAPQQTMTWPELQKWAAAQRPRVSTPTLMHFLTKLTRGEIPSWRGGITPPDLSQQKYAVDIPNGSNGTYRLFSFTARQAAPEPVEKSDDTLAHLGSSLPAALKSAGLELDPSSRMPTLTLKNGFIELEIGKKNQEVTIRVRHGHSVKVPADTELVVGAVLKEIARCFPKKFDLPAFVNRLKAAYSALPGSERGSLSLDEVRRKLRNPAMLGDEFAAALAAVIHERPPEAAGMKLDHTRDIETGFLLPGFEDRGYFGGITFESARQVEPAPVEQVEPAPVEQVEPAPVEQAVPVEKVEPAPSRTGLRGRDMSQKSRAPLRYEYLITPRIADERRKEITGVIFVGASLDFKSEGFSYSTISKCFFENADLSGADFTNTTITDTSFAGANLEDAQFNQAKLTRVSFAGAKLTRADFFGASADSVVFPASQESSDSDVVSITSGPGGLVAALKEEAPRLFEFSGLVEGTAFTIDIDL